MEAVSQISTDFLDWQNQVLREWVYKAAKPKIRGEITAGKLKWRGIILAKRGWRFWLEQRGVKISPEFYIEFPELPGGL